METEVLKVCLPAISFSLLLMETRKALHFQEGFMIGDILELKKEEMVGQAKKVTNYKTIYIKSVIPCPENQFFYDGLGCVNWKKLEMFLGDNLPNVIAWYKHKLTLDLTFREQVIHRQLSTKFNPSNPLNFTYCCLSKSDSSKRANDTYKQMFLRYKSDENVYEQISMRVENINSNNDYLPQQPSSQLYKDLVTKLGLEEDVCTVDMAIRILKGLKNETAATIKELDVYEKKLFRLEHRVRRLKIQFCTRSITPTSDDASTSRSQP